MTSQTFSQNPGERGKSQQQQLTVSTARGTFLAGLMTKTFRRNVNADQRWKPARAEETFFLNRIYEKMSTFLLGQPPHQLCRYRMSYRRDPDVNQSSG